MENLKQILLKNKLTQLLMLFSLILIISACSSQCDNSLMINRKLELQLQNGNVITKTFRVPENSYIYISTNKGSYALMCNYGCVAQKTGLINNVTHYRLMSGVIHFEHIK